MQFFKAGVQYGDWEGTAAADNADIHLPTISKLLKDAGKLSDDDALIAVEFWVGENKGSTATSLGSVFVHAYIFEGIKSVEDLQRKLDAIGNEPIPVRQEDLDLSIDRFILLFKRFAVMLTTRGAPLEGREFSITNS